MEPVAIGLESSPLPDSPVNKRSFASEVIYLAIHVVVIYLIAEEGAPFLGSWIYHHIFLSFGFRPGTVSEFEATHLFLLNAAVALPAGFCNYRSRHIGAFWVWLIPTAILAFQIFTFHNSLSLFASNRWTTTFNYYFNANHVVIGEIARDFRNMRDMFNNPDFVRFIEQYRFTAPFYAGIAYSLGAFISNQGYRSRVSSPSESI